MHQIDGAGATAQNTFTEGDAQQAIPATRVTAEWLTAVQEELVAIAEHNGGVLDKEDNGQVLAKILEILATGSGLAKDLSQDNGYVTLPSGIILQWSLIQTLPTVQNFSYPIAFPNLSLNVWITSSGSVIGDGEIQQADLVNNAQFEAANSSPSLRTARVFAIGF